MELFLTSSVYVDSLTKTDLKLTCPSDEPCTSGTIFFFSTPASPRSCSCCRSGSPSPRRTSPAWRSVAAWNISIVSKNLLILWYFYEHQWEMSRARDNEMFGHIWRVIIDVGVGLTISNNQICTEASNTEKLPYKNFRFNKILISSQWWLSDLKVHLKQ